MPITSRRTFVAWLATLPPATLLARESNAERRAPSAESRSPSLPGAPLDEAKLRALAEAVLPSEIGKAGIDREVAAFRKWLVEYKPGAELVHGYGTVAIRRSPADPTGRWASQLEALDAEARTRNDGVAFTRLNLEARRRLIRDALKEERGGLPNVGEARHVGLAMLAHFYASPDAEDLCYRARIQRNACRPLAQSPVKP